MFLNPSLRTRASFELGMQQLGGIAIVLQPGKDAWDRYFGRYAAINLGIKGDRTEHVLWRL